MRTLLIEVEDEVVEKLEQVASGQSARHSELISMAIRKALWEVEEQDTARAYARQPDSAEETYIDPDVWD